MSLTLEVDVRALGLLSGLRKAEKRMAFAVVNALNNTAKDIQKEVRANVKQRFRVRKEGFIMREAAIIRFASVKKGVMEAKVEVGRKPRLLLSEFESGFQRRPQRALKRVGEERIGVPAAARPSPSAIIPEALWLSKLGLKSPGRARKRRGKAPAVTGAFVIPGIAVVRRVAMGLERLYTLARDVRVRPRLGFYDVARRLSGLRFTHNLEREVIAALRYAFFGR